MIAAKTAPRTAAAANQASVETMGRVHCFICTHHVPAIVIKHGQRLTTKPGQSCPRCNSTLDAAYAMLPVHAG